MSGQSLAKEKTLSVKERHRTPNPRRPARSRRPGRPSMRFCGRMPPWWTPKDWIRGSALSDLIHWWGKKLAAPISGVKENSPRVAGFSQGNLSSWNLAFREDQRAGTLGALVAEFAELLGY